ncbi:unnamed protein product, partial [Brassica oleracea]
MASFLGIIIFIKFLLSLLKIVHISIDDTVPKDLKIVDSSRILASLIIFCNYPVSLSLLASAFSNSIPKS